MGHAKSAMDPGTTSRSVKSRMAISSSGPTRLPNPEKGEVVVKTEWLSLDPTNRIWMSDIRQYMPPVALGAPMRGLICGTAVKSASDWSRRVRS